MIAVVGATSPVGRGVVDELVRDGQRVRALTRRPAQAGLPAPVDVVAADLDRPGTLPPVLEGVRAVFVFAGRADHVRTLVDAARQAGVRRVVLWSSGAVQDGVAEQPDAIAAGYAAMEDAVTGSGLEHTVVRVELTAANALLWLADLPGQVKAGDVVHGPFAEASQAPVDPRDVAAVIAVVLTGDGHDGRRYRLTGPESLTHREQVETIAALLGRPLTYEEVPVDELRRTSGLPPFLLEPLLQSWAQHTAGPARVTGTVEQVTGRPARSYRTWAADHLDLFR